MHPTLKPKEEWTRQETVSFYLRTLALHVDPDNGRIQALALALEINKLTLYRWKAQGYVPWHQVKKMQRRYGKKLVPENELCPVENRDR